MTIEKNDLAIAAIFTAIYGARLIYQGYLLKRRQQAKEKGNWDWLLLTMISKNGLVAIAITLLVFGVQRNFLFFLGWAIFLFGISIRFVALKQLGPMYSSNVELRENHELIRTGIYSFVRHPLYFAYIVDTLGIVLFLQKAIFVPVLILVIFGIAKRIRNEEKSLERLLGQQYLDYEKEVPSLNLFSSVYKKLRTKK